MKRQDLILILCVCIVLAPFFIPATGFLDGFKNLTNAYPYVMSFFKFALLSTLGEMIGLRIRKGVYNEPGFGVVPRMMVWGFLGMGICLAMSVFKAGMPVVLGTIASCCTENRGETIAAIVETFNGPLSWGKVGIAFSISVAMNSIFAPVMMTFHKCTDIHILRTGGTVNGLLSRMPMGEMLSSIDWQRHWGFTLKKTIPLFWFPAHTITFLLPGTWQVLFAAVLGVALGVMLAIANNKK
ncbi:MAG: hypothetical protein IJV22_06945 [Bacteroidales bacterium]|nr:hypothetical protein [Bacteroidales bacterium]